MWRDYREKYGLRGKVLSTSMALKELSDMRRYRVVLIDESHYFRNREGRVYRAVADYIARNDSSCILLTATPYNKSYLDLSSQLRLFVNENKDLGVRPERLLQSLGETEFARRHQCQPGTLAGFEHSADADDWRELMRLYLVRRTRSFIIDNYAETDADNGRRYLLLANGQRSYFPERVPKTAKFTADPQYAQLYHHDVVDKVNALQLPRYGLGNYVAANPTVQATAAEARLIDDLGRAGRRLKGFCRTNLFKRLESCGYAFLTSVERHVLRNFIFIHALENGLPIPIGPQGAEMLDSRSSDSDEQVAAAAALTLDLDDGPDGEGGEPEPTQGATTEDAFRSRAEEVYALYTGSLSRRFRWLRPGLLNPDLRDDLLRDARDLLRVLALVPKWDPTQDGKLVALRKLLAQTHASEKVLVFTEFADTVHYLTRELKAAGVSGVEGVTGDSANPTEMAWRFSPGSNGKRVQVPPSSEIRVLLATDVLSEGQNLQDCRIVVSFDLPWAIIRLIQRAGRVDRIGQTAETVLCYSFLPAKGVEQVIQLRSRVRARLHQNAEVVGTDEAFFEDELRDQTILDLYHERAGMLDGDEDMEVDLASYAYQVWQNAVEADPSLRRSIAELPSVVYSTKEHSQSPPREVRGREQKSNPDGVLLYMHTAEGNDALAWVDASGSGVTQSQYRILRAAECLPETPALQRRPDHHTLVEKGVALISSERRHVGGQLGRPAGARFRTYERLKAYAQGVAGTLLDHPGLQSAVEDIYRYPLTQAATDALNRHLRSGATDETLAQLVLMYRQEDRLVLATEEQRDREPHIICSMGLKPPAE
jgi:hypothetical protein